MLKSIQQKHPVDNDNSNQPLKQRTARSVKWNIVDRFGSQVLYAVTGVVLARQLSPEAFGLVGAIAVFQAFALLFVDSGFSYALIQRKQPTHDDYSTVFWFNLATACLIYVALWFAAPAIALIFNASHELVPLSRLMFLTFIINATAIVQTNRLMKQMNFKPIAIINCLSLAVGGVVGITLAYCDFGAWAIVWQAIALNTSKSAMLWGYCRWLPSLTMRWTILRSYFGVGGGMMMTSFLNTVFQNIYAFFIGNRVGMVPLGYYTQADKWSKMGVTGVTQVLTSSFLPTLSEVQDDPERFRRVVAKMNRVTAFILFPAMIFLSAMAQPIFHTLFGDKWDASIILFQLLLARGVFTILNTLYTNYILALGHSRAIFRLEVVRDGASLVAIVATLPYIALSSPTSVVEGLEIFLAAQVVASLISWIVSLCVTSRITSIAVADYLRHIAPYAVIAAAIGCALWALTLTGWSAPAVLAVQMVAGVGAYLGINAFAGSKVQAEVLAHLRPGKGV